MKSLAAVLSVMILLLSAVALSDSCSGEAGEEFEDGDFSYIVLNPTDVELWAYDNDSTVADVVIGDEVVHDEHHYKITRVTAWFTSDSIRTVTIHSNVEYIDEYSFHCNNLESFDVIGNTRFGVDDGVLYEMNGINLHRLIKYPSARAGDSYDVPATVVEIGTGAFSNSSVKTVTFHEGLIKIDTSAFYDCTELTNIRTGVLDNTLPKSLSIIGNAAFNNCSKLSSISLPDELSFIGSRAFEESGLTELRIPYELDYIGEGAFMNCTKLTRFTSDSYSYQADEETGVLYRIGMNDSKILYAYPAGSSAIEYRIPEDVNDIAPYSFSGCVNLQTVHLNDDCLSIPDLAFFDCKSLRSIDLNGVLTTGTASFSGCENLSSVNFGDNLTYIGMLSFSYTALTSVTIPSSVQYIGFGAFRNCYGLTDFTISEDSKATLEPNVFINDRALRNITINSGDVDLMDESLSISESEADKATLNVHVVKGYSVPEGAADEYTELNIIVIGERPYPWENWIGVFFCVLVIIAILMAVREV